MRTTGTVLVGTLSLGLLACTGLTPRTFGDAGGDAGADAGADAGDTRCAAQDSGTVCSSVCSKSNCDAGQCALATLTTGTCNEVSAACGTPVGISCPSSLNCRDATSCHDACAIDAHCLSGTYCADGGACTPKGVIGGGCTSDNQCRSGVCSNATGKCVLCVSNKDCSPTQAQCYGGSCVSCSDGAPSFQCIASGFDNFCELQAGGSNVCKCDPASVSRCGNPRAPHCSNFGDPCSCGGIVCARESFQLCTTTDAGGSCKVAPGGPCQENADCAGGICDGGACWKLATGQPCRAASDCLSGACGANFVCL